MIMGQLYEFGERASQGLRMDKCDSAPSTPGPGSSIDKVGAFVGKISQSLIKVVDGECQMMQAFPVSFEKPTHGTVARKRLKQLHE